MYTAWYEGISGKIRASGGARALRIADKALVFVVAAAYIGTAIWLAVTQDAHVVKFICVPAATFVLATVLRMAINAPRPYERYSIQPLFEDDTRGKSLPSRHTASAFAIACAFFWLNPIVGAIALVVAVAIAVLRIVGGVHFPRDIAAAIALAAACAAIGFLAIP